MKRGGRLWAGAFIVTMLTLSTADRAVAGSGGGRRPGEKSPAESTGEGGVVTASVGVPGSSGSVGSGGPSPWTDCVSGDMGDLDRLGGLLEGVPAWFTGARDGEVERLAGLSEVERAGATGFTTCRRRDGGGVGGWLTGSGGLDATAGLLLEARRELVLPLPDVETSPPVDGVMPVGLPVWFWASNGQERSETAAVPGVAVTIDASVSSMEVVIDEPVGRSGGGVRRVRLGCAGVGEAYAPERDDVWDRSDCSHSFDWPGDAAVRVSVTWVLSWSSNTGASGVLDPVVRTSTVTVHPVELQAVID